MIHNSTSDMCLIVFAHDLAVKSLEFEGKKTLQTPQIFSSTSCFSVGIEASMLLWFSMMSWNVL